RPRRTAQRPRLRGGASQCGQTSALALMKPPQREQVVSWSMSAIVDVPLARGQSKNRMPLRRTPLRQAPLRRLEITPETPLHPAYVVWELTLACDQPCTHCGSRAGEARPAELSTEAALKVVGELAAAGAREVVLLGGEAYLHPGFLDIVAALARAGIRPTLTTGGRGITPALAARMAAAGLHTASVSIDGLEPTHDLMRACRGSFASATAALGHLRRAGVLTAANTNINRLNAGELEALYDHLASLGITAWQVQLTAPLGRAEGQGARRRHPGDAREQPRLLRPRGGHAALAGARGPGPLAGLPGRSLRDGDRVRRRGQGVSVAADRPLRGGQPPGDAARRHLGPGARAGVCPPKDRRRSVGLLPHVHLRRHLPRGLLLHRARRLRAPRQQPLLPLPRSHPGPRRAPRAARPQDGGAGRPVRQRNVRPRRGAARFAGSPSHFTSRAGEDPPAELDP